MKSLAPLAWERDLGRGVRKVSYLVETHQEPGADHGVGVAVGQVVELLDVMPCDTAPTNTFKLLEPFCVAVVNVTCPSLQDSANTTLSLSEFEMALETV